MTAASAQIKSDKMLPSGEATGTGEGGGGQPDTAGHPNVIEEGTDTQGGTGSGPGSSTNSCSRHHGQLSVFHSLNSVHW